MRCSRAGCPVSVLVTAALSTAERDDHLPRLRLADAGTERAAPTPAIGVKDRGKSYWRQVAETVWVSAVFAAGMWLGAVMAGAH